MSLLIATLVFTVNYCVIITSLMFNNFLAFGYRIIADKLSCVHQFVSI